MVQFALLINDERRGQFHFDVVVVVVKSFALLVFFLGSTVAGGGGGDGRVQFSITYTLVVTHLIVMGMIISISVGLFFFLYLFFLFLFCVAIEFERVGSHGYRTWIIQLNGTSEPFSLVPEK